MKTNKQLKLSPSAINLMAQEYGQELLEPELRPEFVEKMLRIKKQKAIHVRTVENLRKRYE